MIAYFRAFGVCTFHKAGRRQRTFISLLTNLLLLSFTATQYGQYTEQAWNLRKRGKIGRNSY